MAVYSPVSEQQLKAFLSDYPVGELIAFQGIDSGIENTNYFVQTSHGHFVLTLFERLGQTQLPYYLDLMDHLAGQQIPCPQPIGNRRGTMLGTLSDKPAALVTRLTGQACEQPDATHCTELGKTLARMHLAARSFNREQPNLRGLDWWRQTIPAVAPRIASRARAMLENELAVQTTHAASAAFKRLPRSAVHADLFRDNVLFDADDGSPVVGGIIDFYFAGTDTWIFDLAVVVNDWCLNDRDGSFDTRRLTALLGAYQGVRRISREEQHAWPYALRAAALRFWVSRLDDAVSPRPAQMLTPKDPLQFERILSARRQDAVTVGQALIAG